MSGSDLIRLPNVVEIGSERQLFLDDLLIDGMENASRFVNQPAKYPDNPIFVTEKPWEWKRVHFCDVIFDEEEKVYKMWYNVWQIKENKEDLCYAVSEDGLHFYRPNLGLVTYEGSKENNLVATPAFGVGPPARVTKDAHDPDPQRRYKMVYMMPGTIGMSVAWSADGVQWTGYEHNPVLVPTGDAEVPAFWDERCGRYVLYVRPDGHHVKRWSRVKDASCFPTRRVGRAESVDFKMWTDVKEIITPDEQDGPGTEFYYMPVLQYQGCYIGFLDVYHEFSGANEGFNYTLDVQLTFSRDGVKWTRVCDRQVFIPLGRTGEWDEKRAYLESTIVKDDEISIYYRGSNIPHYDINGLIGKTVNGRELKGDALGLAKLRLDGFVSVDAGDRDGSLTTKPLTFEGGSELRVNADASKGSMQVEALTIFGEPVKGFTRDECPPITSDSLRHKVVWTSGKTLKDQEKPVRLRFIMRNTKLYSFQIAP